MDLAPVTQLMSAFNYSLYVMYRYFPCIVLCRMYRAGRPVIHQPGELPKSSSSKPSE